MKVEFNFVFDRKKKAPRPTDKAIIELRAYCNAKTKYLSTKIEICRQQWNEEKERINSKNSNADFLNGDLEKIIEKLNRARREAEFKNLSFSLDNVKAIFKNQRKQTVSFIDFTNEEIEKDNVLKIQTKRKHWDTIKKLKVYNQNKDVLFTDLTYRFLDGFKNYLFGLGLGQNTVRNHNKNIKAIIERAIKKGYFEQANPCKQIKIREQETKRDVLSWTQIQKLDSLKFEDYEEKLKHIRDMFLFSCYTGLRISDVTNLKTEFIKQTEEGLQLDFFTVKVNKHAVLPLLKLFPIKQEDSSRPIKILQKYFNETNEFLFPKYTDQYINRELKQIALLAEFDIKLTFHIGRETFATYMANKIPTPTLKRLLQHTNLKTTEKYIHLNEQMVKENLIKAVWD